jgi:hypothetical protein
LSAASGAEVPFRRGLRAAGGAGGHGRKLVHPAI